MTDPGLGDAILAARDAVLSREVSRETILQEFPVLKPYERTVRMIMDPRCSDAVLREMVNVIYNGGDKAVLGKRMREQYNAPEK